MMALTIDSWQIMDALDLGRGHAQKCNTEVASTFGSSELIRKHSSLYHWPG